MEVARLVELPVAEDNTEEEEAESEAEQDQEEGEEGGQAGLLQRLLCCVAATSQPLLASKHRNLRVAVRNTCFPPPVHCWYLFQTSISTSDLSHEQLIGYEQLYCAGFVYLLCSL